MTGQLNVAMGTHEIGGTDGLVLRAIVGSCVCVCVFDPSAGRGGMCHFLLPGRKRAGAIDLSSRESIYGAYLIEAMFNRLIEVGCRKRSFAADLFGGANMHGFRTAIGSSNAEFVTGYLQREGVAIRRAELGGTRARAVRFRAELGQSSFAYVDDAAFPGPEIERLEIGSPSMKQGTIKIFGDKSAAGNANPVRRGHDA